MIGFRSIRWRIAVPYVVLILLILAGLGAFLSNRLRDAQLAELETRLHDQASTAADALAPILATVSAGEDLDQEAKQWSDIFGSRVTIIGSDGVVLGESDEDRLQMDNHLNRPEVIEAQKSGSGSSIRYSRTVGVSMMYSAVRISQGDRLVGFLRFALPLAEVESNQTQLRRTIYVAMVVAAVFAVILGILVAERTTLPLRKLSESVKRLAEGDLEVKIVPTTKDEVGQLTRSVNVMAGSLRSQFAKLDDERIKLSSVLNQMTDGVLMVDKQGNILLLNLSAQRIFSIESDQATGKSLVEVVRHHQIVEVWQQSRSLSEPQTSAFELGPGQSFFEVVAIPFSTTLEGNVLLLVRDLTQMRRLETIRRDFISNVSHELRTPLASLRALVDTLTGGASENQAEAIYFLGRMDEELDSLTQMVQELLELSRIESGRVPLALVKVSPGELLEAAAERIRLQAERAQLQISCATSQGLPFVMADPDRISQVLGNLLHNAVKFTPEGGTITLSAGQHGDMVVFRVEDTGVGIPQEELPRIFERFYKADRSRSGGGTGLGLAISRHLVEAHGGKIWAESVEGRGSSFYFTLPISRN
ncbi:MAG TPA: ATP-binding protein [Anaerolineales bacterium]|nr:ATP-binding protein [Anaerolineales bacterium]